MFSIIEGVFLCVDDVLIVLCGIELNDLLHCGTEGRYVIGWTQGWSSLELDRDGWISSCE